MATTITLDPPPAAEPEHARFLSDVRRRHRPIVLALSRQVLGLEGAAPLRRWRHWWMEPLLYTLEGLTNFFRCAFAFGMAELAGHPAVGPCAATAGEIAWSCTLMLDDMVDGAHEREGRPAAHLVYGRDRKSTRLNSSHVRISYAVFCLKKKKMFKAYIICLDISTDGDK